MAYMLLSGCSFANFKLVRPSDALNHNQLHAGIIWYRTDSATPRRRGLFPVTNTVCCSFSSIPPPDELIIIDRIRCARADRQPDTFCINDCNSCRLVGSIPAHCLHSTDRIDWRLQLVWACTCTSQSTAWAACLLFRPSPSLPYPGVYSSIGIRIHLVCFKLLSAAHNIWWKRVGLARVSPNVLGLHLTTSKLSHTPSLI